MDGKSLDIRADKLAQLKSLFPEIFSENKIDFQRLKNVLDEDVFVENEHYELSWAGKNAARKEVQKQTIATLIQDKNNGIDLQKPQNVFIEGENLEVLRVLQKSYFGKVKLIYIDPPYNTGNDSFIYPDNYSERQNTYKKRSGIADENGYLNKQDFWKKNTKENGQFHSVWLSMMYPRLYLSRNLLREDGVIFISIDDNEVANLKLLCNEIYGEENFLGQIVWQTATDNNPTQIAIEHEYVLCYAKNKMQQDIWELPSEKGLIIQQKYEDLKKIYPSINDIQSNLRKWLKEQEKNLQGVSHYAYVDEKGVFYPGNSANTKPGGYNYDIIHPISNKICAKPEYGYRFKKDTFDNAHNNGDVLWGDDETTIPKIKKRLETTMQKLKSYYYEDNRSTTQDLKNLMNNVKIFNNPKSINFLKQILKFTTHNGDNQIVLDFFAGSGSTAQAVLELNEEDNGSRQFILVQMPEPTSEKSEAFKANFKTIAEITKTRIQKAIEKINNERKINQKVKNKTPLGFISYTLAESNFKIWQTNIQGKKAIEQELLNLKNTAKNHEKCDLMFTELCLKNGLVLNAEHKKESGFYKLYYGIWMYFEEDLTDKMDEIIAQKPLKVICLNSCFKSDSELILFISELQSNKIALNII